MWSVSHPWVHSYKVNTSVGEITTATDRFTSKNRRSGRGRERHKYYWEMEECYWRRAPSPIGTKL